MASAEDNKLVEEYIAAPAPADDYRILKKILGQKLWDEQKTKKTVNGATLWDCLKSGVLCPDSKMGIYGADAESYETFRDVFDPMILAYFNTDQYHPKQDFGDIDDPAVAEIFNLKAADPDNDLIASTRVRIARNLEGFPYAAILTKEQRLAVEKTISDGTASFQEDKGLAGTFHTLGDYDEKTQAEMVNNHLLFHNRDSYIEKAGMYRDWPSGRGAYYNSDNSFMIWVNEEDHMRIISLQQGNDLLECYRRLVKAQLALSKTVKFAFDKDYGALASCPTNLGTGLRASVHIRLPLLSKQSTFKSICDNLGVDIRGIHGEHSQSDDGTFDISNRTRFGKSEFECLSIMARGVKVLAAFERALQGKDKGTEQFQT